MYQQRNYEIIPNMSYSNLTNDLKNYFRFDDFREGQQDVIINILEGKSTLAIFPTGSGKSLCYQFSALQLPNLTLVVSPLLALMKDQLAFLKAHNIPAASLDSTLSYEAYRNVVADIKNNKLKILMVSVERFKNERFRLLMENVAISLLVVDEAHCISEWGHNFRPDYLKLPSYQKALHIPQALLLTATATKRVKNDIASKFNLTDKDIIQTGFYRSNLNLHVLSVPENNKDRELHRLTSEYKGQSGIVYVTLQKTTERIADYLQKLGINACAYHAGMKNEARTSIQDGFMRGDISLVIATIAFGMGVDKANIRYIVHYDLPKSIENYSQEIGRAGRDGLSSDCFVLGNLDALNTIENFIYGDTPEQSAIEAVLDDIISNLHNGQWEMQLYRLSNASNVRQLTLKTLLVQLEMQEVLTPLYSYNAEYSVKLLCDQEVIFSVFKGERQTFTKCVLNNIQFKRTWGVIDFDGVYSDCQKEGINGERKRVISALEYFKDNNWVEFKTSSAIDVFSVDDSLIDHSLAIYLTNHFQSHEKNEIKRIELMLRFLQSTSCLSYGLAKYFDDHNAPKKCGHCSTCKKQNVIFSKSKTHSINTSQLEEAIQNITIHLQDNGVAKPSNHLIARFLIGINMPIFTRTKAKTVPGFGIAEMMRYATVLEQIVSKDS